MHMDRTSCNAEKLVWQQESRTIKSPAVKIKREKGKSTAIISDVSLLQNSHQTLSWRHSLGQEARVSSAAVKGTSERSQVEPARRIAPALARYPPGHEVALGVGARRVNVRQVGARGITDLRVVGRAVYRGEVGGARGA